MRIIIVAGSKYQNFHNYTYLDGDFLIGIEDGAFAVITRGLKLDLAIGDFDTTTHYDEIINNARNVKKFPIEKDEIDLELAIKYVEEYYPDSEVFIYNATLGRMDHELITIKLLIKYAHLTIHLMNDLEEIIYLTSDFVINKPNIRFSLIPLEEVELEVIGAKYPLSKTTIKLLDCYTSSNQTNDTTYINIYNGGVILVKEV